MATISTIKFAGPDDHDRFKCLTVKGRLVVDPGKIYSRDTVEALNSLTNRSKYDVTTIEPKFETRVRLFKGVDGKEVRR